jgi:serine protease AprX
MKQSISIFFILLIHVLGQSQEIEKYWVFFSDKCTENFDPHTFFDQKAIERRLKNHIPLNHYTDYPVCETYIATISQNVDSVSQSSRWFNALAVYSNQNQIDDIIKFDFVDSVKLMYGQEIDFNITCQTPETSSKSKSKKEQLLVAQTKIMGGEVLKRNNLNGSTIRIAILDAGFPSVNTSKIFKHIRDSNKIISTFDFVKNKENVYGYSSHGTNVLSCIAGIHNETNIGLATSAEFLLARTENSKTEPFSEEENWLAAAEWADKNGAQIINSSLAYTKHRYFTSEMDGHTSLVSKAATMAARKGILVVNAAGNDGDSNWKYIATPADADSVLTVGGINPYTNYHIDFSSYGPTADKRMKPNVCAYGKTVVGGNNEIHISEGTSFSSPLIAGYAACIWQLHPKKNNMEIFEIIQKSAYLYPYYDYAHGYGMPNANYFFEEQVQALPTLSFDETENNIVFRIKDGEYSPTPFLDYLYYHIENSEGVLTKYGVIEIETQSPTQIAKYLLNPNDVLRVFYKGYIASYKM